MPRVDNPATATLAPPLPAPTDLSQAAGSRNHVARVGPLDQMNLKRPILLITQQVDDTRRESSSLNDNHGLLEYTSVAHMRQW